jgi:hypothetical protein
MGILHLAGYQLPINLNGRIVYEVMLTCDIMLLARIHFNVVDSGDLIIIALRSLEGIVGLEVNLELMPAYGRRIGLGSVVAANAERHPFSVGAVLPSQQELRLVYAVDGSIVRDLSSAESSKGAEEIKGAHYPAAHDIIRPRTNFYDLCREKPATCMIVEKRTERIWQMAVGSRFPSQD